MDCPFHLFTPTGRSDLALACLCCGAGVHVCTLDGADEVVGLRMHEATPLPVLVVRDIDRWC